MAKDTKTRNLRDGTIVIKDADSPVNTCTLVLDNGDLSWTEKKNTIEIKDRGSISAGHTRRGDDESVDISYGVKWTHLIQGTVLLSDGLVVYEMHNGLYSGATSTSTTGEQYTVLIEFTVAAPGGVSNTSEKIAFAKVYTESLTCGEGADFNKIDFKGKDFETRPTITRV